MKTLRLLALLLTAFALASCDGKGGNSDDGGESSGVPRFSSDSCYQYVARQTAFGPRVPNTAAHDSCAAYFVRHFERLGLKTTVQRADLRAHDGKVLRASNIIASVNPEAASRIFVCAHWDSRPRCDEDPDEADRDKPVLGANDGASGAGVIMELARVAAAELPPIGVDFILFDAEDYGVSEAGAESYCLGSQHWARNIDRKSYKPSFGILLDMVGAPDAAFYREEVSRAYAGHVLDLVWQRARELGYGSVFLNKETPGLVDDHYFVNTIASIPCIDIIHCTPDGGFPPTWHTSDDDMEHISQSTLGVVGDVLTHIIYELQ